MTLAARAWAYTVTFGVALVTLWPGLDASFKDSFPLSNYPMFARHRGKPPLVQMVGIGKEDAPLVLGPPLIGTREVLQAKVIIERAAAGGTQARAEFCAEVAKRVAVRTNPRYREIHRVEMVRVQFDPIGYFEKGPIPMSRKVIVSCPVERSGE